MNDEQQIAKAFRSGFITYFEASELLNILRAQRELQEKLMKNDDIASKIQRDKEFLRKKQSEKAAKEDEMNKLYYAGIGSRSTPEYVLTLMEQLACRLREDRMILRSGHAPGADQAFERGAGGAAQIFLPWPYFQQDADFTASRSINADGEYVLDEDGQPKIVRPHIFNEPSDEAFEVASDFHPAWDRLTQGAKKVHARNSHQILGPLPLSRPTPVEFVVCWTPDGAMAGGTAQAMRIAQSIDIPIHNLAIEEVYDMAFEWAWDD